MTRLVTLMDGRQVPNDSEEWRAECEARFVCDMLGQDHRRDFLAMVERKRGKAARESLEGDMATVWRRREAERVIAMQTLHERRRHLELIEYERGLYARRELEHEIARLWKPRTSS